VNLIISNIWCNFYFGSSSIKIQLYHKKISITFMRTSSQGFNAMSQWRMARNFNMISICGCYYGGGFGFFLTVVVETIQLRYESVSTVSKFNFFFPSRRREGGSLGGGGDVRFEKDVSISVLSIHNKANWYTNGIRLIP